MRWLSQDAHRGLLPHIGPDTEGVDPVLNTMAGGPSVDRTLTGGGETLALTSAQVAEEPRGDPTLVESFTPRVGAATQESKVCG